MTAYYFDERGHCRSDDGKPELSDLEICRRLTEWDSLVDQVETNSRALAYQDLTHKEALSAYKKRMHPRLDDADRFVALAMAYVTQDPKFAVLCDNATLHPATVDDVRYAVDVARGQ